VAQDDRDSSDRLIDDVARAMTAARVDESFARRVSARLQDPGAQAPRTWPRAWLLAPAAVAVLLALLATSLLRDGNVRLTSSRATAVKKPDATVIVEPKAPPETASDTTAAARGTARPQDALSPGPSALSPQPLPAPPPVAVDPLVTPPIEFAALDVSPLMTVMPIEIQAIAIERIDIPPMP
jgi:hypothetical protein